MLHYGKNSYKLNTNFRKLLKYCIVKIDKGTVDEMNKNAFVSIMALHGDTRRTLAQALGVTTHTVGEKINGHSDFKQSEIKIVIDRYNLTPTQVDKIFFGVAEPWTSL